MAKKKYLKSFYLKDYILITLGLLLYAVGVVGFLVPGHLVTGGGVGIALLVEYGVGIPLQYTNLGINIVLILIAYKVLGGRFLTKTIYGVLMLTLLLALCRIYIKEGFVENETLMSGIIGGMLMGSGIGIVFSSGGSTGGMDIVIAIITKYKKISFGRVMLIFDCCIISSSYLISHNYKIIVASIIVLAVTSYTIDMVINGYRRSVQLLIFSSKYDKIATAINSELNRGCTAIDGVGWYTKKPVKILIVVTKQTEADDLYRLIQSVDPNVFISESSVRNVYGQGFSLNR